MIEAAIVAENVLPRIPPQEQQSQPFLEDCEDFCVMQGGIVKKEKNFRQKGKPMLLTIEDPQQPGTDIGSGAFNIAQVVVNIPWCMQIPQHSSA